MPAPVISALTSVLAPFLGELWSYQPAATNAPTSWREVMPQFAFTNSPSTDILTLSSMPFKDGDRVRVSCTGTPPAGLTNGEYYYVRDIVGLTCRLAALPTSATYSAKAVTGATSGNLFTSTTAHGLSIGDRVTFPTLTGGSSLTAATVIYYVLTTPSTTTFTISATSGGSTQALGSTVTAGTVKKTEGIDLTDAGSGIHCIGLSALPPGLNFNAASGLISGTPTQRGVFELTLVANNKYLGTTFTADTSTDILTPASVGDLVDGDIVRVSSANTLPSPLAADIDYFIRDSTGTTFKLATTAGGTAINITSAGYAVHRIGRVTDGDSAAFIFPIGIRDSRTVLDAAIPLQWDWDTNLVHRLGGDPSVNLAEPVLHLKNGDKIVLAVQFVKGSLPFAPSLVDIYAAIRHEDEESQLALSAGTFGTVGSGPDVRYYLLLDLTSVPTGGAAVTTAIDEIATDGPDVVDAWLELRCTYPYDVLKTGSTSNLVRASRSIPIKISRSLIAA